MSWQDDESMRSSSRGCVNVTTLYPKKGTAIKDYPRSWFLLSLLAACLMCFNGGFINGICFAGPWHSGLTHVTGSVTLSGIAIGIYAGVRLAIPAKPGQYTWWEYGTFIFAFGAGAIFAGFILGSAWQRWGRLQASLCILHGLLLILALYLQHEFQHMYISAIAISIAMGIQNTISSLYAPMTIRTSHVSGTVLDIGVVIGQMIRHRNLEGLWKLWIHIPNVFFYWVGAVCGTFAYIPLGAKALYINSGMAIVLGVLTFVLFRTPLCYFEDLLAPINPAASGIVEAQTIVKLKPESTHSGSYGSLSSGLVELEGMEMKKF